MKDFEISTAGVELLEELEGFRSTVYLDEGGRPTIGYGTLIDMKEEEWLLKARIDKATARTLLLSDLRPTEKCVNDYVNTAINQNQFDALCIFAYNVGCFNFKQSTLLRYINISPEHFAIKDQFLRWNKIHATDGSLITSKGLTKRRTKEYTLYFLPIKKTTTA